MSDMWNNVGVYGPAAEIEQFKQLCINPSEYLTTGGQFGWDGCDCHIIVPPAVSGAGDRHDDTVLKFYVSNFQQFVVKSPNEYSCSFDTDGSFPEHVFGRLAARFPKLAFNCESIEATDECMGFGWFNAPTGGEAYQQDYPVPKNYWSSGSGYKRSRPAQLAHEARIDALLEAARKADRMQQLFNSASLT